MDMLQKKGKPTQCDDPDYRKQLLSYIKEMPFVGLFGDVRGTTKWVTQHSTARHSCRPPRPPHVGRVPPMESRHSEVQTRPL